MIIVVDAYNVLKQLQQKMITEQERREFINLLKKYARNKGHRVVVVFDGGPCTWPSKEVVNHITVVYSGSQLSADDYIRRYMKEHNNKELLLVTSDRELRDNGTRLNVDVIKSLDFYRMLNVSREKKEKKQSTILIKLSEDSVQEVDDLMAELSEVRPKEEEEVLKRVKSGFTPSKKERKIMKKVKKLNS